MAKKKRTPEMIDRIISGVSNGITLAQCCRDERIHPWTFYEWKKTDDELSQRFARAREVGFDVIADDCVRIADTPLEGQTVTIDANGEKITREDMLGHRKLQIETRLKLLAKWDPTRYGDRQIIAGDENSPLAVSLAESILLARKRAGKDSQATDSDNG